MSSWRIVGTILFEMITPGGLVDTIAGFGGSPGSSNGAGNRARFTNPFGVAVATNGDVYVADSSNNTIRKITPEGTNWVVTTIAGLVGSSGRADGTNNSARFRSPHGVATDNAGNIYVADSWNNTIRKITPVGPNWVVNTIAGMAGSQGSTDGVGGNARFNDPTTVAINSFGNLYVADQDNYTVRKGNPAGLSPRWPDRLVILVLMMVQERMRFLAPRTELRWMTSAMSMCPTRTAKRFVKSVLRE